MQYQALNQLKAPAQAVAAIGQPSVNLAMPMLGAALDNGVMTSYLQPRLQPISDRNDGLQVVSSELADCKPGKRALVRYELMAPRPLRGVGSQRTKTVVYGKTYTDQDQLMRVENVMDMLWRNIFSNDTICGMPQPLGVIPGLSMFVYLPAEGEFLDTTLDSREAAGNMDMTARWLSTLHRHPLRLTKRFDLSNELTNLGVWAALVGQTVPEMASLAHQLFFFLQQQAEALPFATETPIHKDFHYRHVLVARGATRMERKLKVIDFDEMRLGDPNFDLAHFCANLHLLSYRKHGAPHRLHHFEERFLQAYARNSGWTRKGFARANRSRFIYFYVYSCLKLARQLCLGFGPGPAPTNEERQRQVEMILKEGAAAAQGATKAAHSATKAISSSDEQMSWAVPAYDVGSETQTRFWL